MPDERTPRPLQPARVLVVEDDNLVQRALGRVIVAWGGSTKYAGSVAVARKLLRGFQPHVVLLDVRLPDGSGVEVAYEALATRSVRGIIVVSGQATAPEAFELGTLHITAYLEKPTNNKDIRAALIAAMVEPSPMGPLPLASLKARGMRALVEQVRVQAFNSAYLQAEGCIAETARLLGVSRQAVQRMVKQYFG